jgi:hypothetical protein
MRTPEDMSFDELRALATKVTRALFWDPDEASWDRDKDWTADTLDEVAGALEQYGLVPDQEGEVFAWTDGYFWWHECCLQVAESDAGIWAVFGPEGVPQGQRCDTCAAPIVGEEGGNPQPGGT